MPVPYDPPKPMAPCAETVAFLALVHPGDGRDVSVHTDSLYEVADGLHDMLAKLRARVADCEAALRKAQKAETDPRIYHWFEEFRQKFSGIDTDMKFAIRTVELVTDTSTQLDVNAARLQQVIDTFSDWTKPDTSQFVILRREEHEALLAKAGEEAPRKEHTLPFVLPGRNDLESGNEAVGGSAVEDETGVGSGAVARAP